jgi:nicotinamidase-related amidase
MGIATNWVVEGTARYAADADYRVIVLEDCCAGISVEAHDFSIANVLSTIAEVSNSQEFLASLK